MARKARVEFPGACYHVIARGNRQLAIFHDDADRRHYLRRLEYYRVRHGATLYAYVLMINHVHLLLETGKTPLSQIMQALQFTYAQYYNWRYEKTGHLFQGRYRAILCDRDAYLLELVRYLHLNPARTETPANPWRYRWSSHPAYMGKPSPVRVETSLVLRQFGARLGPARRAYLAFLAQGLADGHQEKYYGTADQQYLGSEEFIKRTAESPQRERDPDGPAAQAPFDLLLRAVAHVHGIAPDRLFRRRQGIRARAMLVFLAREWRGLSTRDLGRRLGRDPSMVSHLYTRYADSRDPSAEERVATWLRGYSDIQA